MNTLLAADPNLINRFLSDIEAAGLVGESENALTIFLAAASAALDHPLHVTIQGSSSAGKNYLMERVSDFLPEERRKFLSGMTPKVLMHAEENEYEHRAVFIAEYEGVSQADYAIRTMQSEKLIEWEFVESTNKGISRKKNKVKGPCAFIQATTRPLLHPENETRLLFVTMDETEALTQEILRRQGREAAMGDQPGVHVNFTEWHELILSLKKTKILVPFAPQLAVNFPVADVRSRRGFPKLLALIQVSAYLHQDQRAVDDGVLAEEADYKLAKRIFENSYEAGPEKSVRRLLEAAEKFPEEFRVGDLMKTLLWGHSKTYEVLKRGMELGCLAEGSFRGLYKFLRLHPLPALRLPDSIEPQSGDVFRVSAERTPLSNIQ